MLKLCIQEARKKMGNSCAEATLWFVQSATARSGKTEVQCFENKLNLRFSKIQAGQLHTTLCLRPSRSAPLMQSVGIKALWSAMCHACAAMERRVQMEGALSEKIEI